MSGVEVGAVGAEPARMPVLFVGHGSPMNALEDNAWTRGFKSMATALPRPTAILAVSAHWYVAGSFVTGNERPRTIHDFGGFPRALFEMQYPAPGSVALAERAVSLLDGRAAVNMEWGLDHGTWTVLHHLYPKADIPVVQLSINGPLAPEEHLALGAALRPLREEGVLILASGNITHNLRHAMGAMQTGKLDTPAWARDFDRDVSSALEQRDHKALTRALDTPAGEKAHPSADHYLPLLYAAGAAQDGDAVTFPVTGFDLGSLSMRSVRWG